MGIPLNWPLGEKFRSYPFHSHDLQRGDLSYKFCHVGANGSDFRVRSNHCLFETTPDGSACISCQAVRTEIDRLAELAAKEPAPTTTHGKCTWAQLKKMLLDRSELVKELKLKVTPIFVA